MLLWTPLEEATCLYYCSREMSDHNVAYFLKHKFGMPRLSDEEIEAKRASLAGFLDNGWNYIATHNAILDHIRVAETPWRTFLDMTKFKREDRVRLTDYQELDMIEQIKSVQDPIVESAVAAMQNEGPMRIGGWADVQHSLSQINKSIPAFDESAFGERHSHGPGLGGPGFSAYNPSPYASLVSGNQDRSTGSVNYAGFDTRYEPATSGQKRVRVEDPEHGREAERSSYTDPRTFYDYQSGARSIETLGSVRHGPCMQIKMDRTARKDQGKLAIKTGETEAREKKRQKSREEAEEKSKRKKEEELQTKMERRLAEPQSRYGSPADASHHHTRPQLPSEWKPLQYGAFLYYTSRAVLPSDVAVLIRSHFKDMKQCPAESDIVVGIDKCGFYDVSEGSWDYSAVNPQIIQQIKNADSTWEKFWKVIKFDFRDERGLKGGLEGIKMIQREQDPYVSGLYYGWPVKEVNELIRLATRGDTMESINERFTGNARYFWQDKLLKKPEMQKRFGYDLAQRRKAGQWNWDLDKNTKVYAGTKR